MNRRNFLKTSGGAFFIAALAHKSMVTNAIFRSGSLMAGFSVDYDKKGFRGIRDFRDLPRACRDYVLFLEKEIETPVRYLSNGPRRDEMIAR